MDDTIMPRLERGAGAAGGASEKDRLRRAWAEAGIEPGRPGGGEERRQGVQQGGRSGRVAPGFSRVRAGSEGDMGAACEE